MRCFFQACAVVLALSTAAVAPAAAQAYPSRPVRMIVPFPPGGAADLIGRVLAQQLSAQLGQQLVATVRGTRLADLAKRSRRRPPTATRCCWAR